MAKPKVLLLDDEPGILRALSRELQSVAEVTAVASVNEALKLIEAQTYDIVIADLRLPDRWGDELLAVVAARAPQTRRMLLTADTDPQRTVRELIDRGVVQDCFQKPFADDLIAAVRGFRTRQPTIKL